MLINLAIQTQKTHSLKDKLPRLTQMETNTYPTYIYTIKELKFLVKNLPAKKIPGQDGFTGEFYKIFK